MIPEKRELSPCVTLYTVNTDKFKTETLSVSLVTPIDRELTPVSMLAMSTLKRGTEKYKTQGELNRRLDELYATGISMRCNRNGNYALIGFSAEMLSEEYTDRKTDVFGGTLETICQMLFCPLTDENGDFLDKYFESEREFQIDTINSQINNPRSYASLRCREIMFGDDIYGSSLIGTPKQVRDFSKQQVMERYKKLISENGFEFFYVGQKSADEVENRIRDIFMKYVAGNKTSVAEPFSMGRRNGDVKRVDESMELAQGKLVLGFRTGVNICSDDFFAMLVANEIYGGSPVSKLFMNVREKMSLCYYCSSSYDIYKGTVFVSSGVAPSDRSVAEGEILGQLELMQKGDISEEEFMLAKKSLFNSYRSIYDSPSAVESYYNGRNRFGVNCSVEECMEGIRNVTLSQVIEASKKIDLDTVYFLSGKGNEEEAYDEDND